MLCYYLAYFCKIDLKLEVISFTEPFLGELKLVLVLGEAFQISHKLGLVLVELFCVLVQQLCSRDHTPIYKFPKGIAYLRTGDQ